MSNLISDVLKLALIVGICALGYYFYQDHQDAKHRRAVEMLEAKQETQNREREETEKQEAELMTKEEKQAKAKEALEVELKVKQEERERKREEARQTKIQEETMAKAREQVKKQAANEAAAETRDRQIDNAQVRLTAVRKEMYLVQSRRDELNRTLVGVNNRLDGARKTAEEAEAKARNYAASGGSRNTGDMSGTSAVPLVPNPMPESASDATIQGGDRGINGLRTDNSELIAKERARAEAARREMLQMQVLAGTAQMEMLTVERRLKELAGEESSLGKYLRDRGEDPSKITWKGVVPPRPENTNDNRVVLKDGTVLHAEKVVDFGTQYSIKTTEGKYIAVDKDKIDSIPEGLVPKK